MTSNLSPEILLSFLTGNTAWKNEIFPKTYVTHCFGYRDLLFLFSTYI